MKHNSWEYGIQFCLPTFSDFTLNTDGKELMLPSDNNKISLSTMYPIIITHAPHSQCDYHITSNNGTCTVVSNSVTFTSR